MLSLILSLLVWRNNAYHMFITHVYYRIFIFMFSVTRKWESSPFQSFVLFINKLEKKGGQITALCWVYQQFSLKTVSTEIWPPLFQWQPTVILNHSSPGSLKKYSSPEILCSWSRAWPGQQISWKFLWRFQCAAKVENPCQIEAEHHHCSLLADL